MTKVQITAKKVIFGGLFAKISWKVGSYHRFYLVFYCFGNSNSTKVQFVLISTRIKERVGHYPPSPHRVQRARESFSTTSEQYDSLKAKVADGGADPGSMNRMYTRQGYLYAQKERRKNKLPGGGGGWSKYFCQYQVGQMDAIGLSPNDIHDSCNESLFSLTYVFRNFLVPG